MSGIKVRAFREGFYRDKRLRVGTEFVVPESTIESGWFAPVDPSIKLKPRPELTPAQKSEALKKRAEERRRFMVETARQKAGQKPVEQVPKALSELHGEQKPTAREQAADEGADNLA